MATNRSILVIITAAGDGRIIVQPPNGSPIVRGPDEFTAELAAMANDPTQPAHKVAPGGFDVGDMLRGVGRLLSEAGAEEKK